MFYIIYVVEVESKTRLQSRACEIPIYTKNPCVLSFSSEWTNQKLYGKILLQETILANSLTTFALCLNPVLSSPALHYTLLPFTISEFIPSRNKY